MRFTVLVGRIKNGRVCLKPGQLKQASLTVECAGILPVFFIACLTLIVFMNAMRIQVKENLSLSNKARKMAMAANLLGENADGNWVDLIKSYKMEFPFPELGVPKLKIALRARVYPWVGSSKGIGGAASDGDGTSKDDTVYLTDNREVYHSHSDCTHLDLTIIKTDMTGVKKLRNAYGKKYRKCPDFPRDYSGPVYVTAKGDYYYPSTNYGSLTRHVQVCRKEEAAGLELCSRCAARDAKEHTHAA